MSIVLLIQYMVLTVKKGLLRLTVATSATPPLFGGGVADVATVRCNKWGATNNKEVEISIREKEQVSRKFHELWDILISCGD